MENRHSKINAEITISVFLAVNNIIKETLLAVELLYGKFKTENQGERNKVKNEILILHKISNTEKNLFNAIILLFAVLSLTS